jgi:hypothetical protein
MFIFFLYLYLYIMKKNIDEKVKDCKIKIKKSSKMPKNKYIVIITVKPPDIIEF